MAKKALLALLLFFLVSSSEAQLALLKRLDEEIDTSYISDRSKMLTVRLLGSSKYYNYRFTDGGNTLSYKANNNYNIGVGAVYGFLGANITVKAPFINQDNSRYGKTRKLDIHAFLFPRKWIMDVYAQYYKGFFIAEKNAVQPFLPENKRVVRPDISTLHIGVNGSYVFNAKKFSFRAAFIQNEYQKKSAGAPLLGGNIHYNRIHGDSSLIPSDIAYTDFFDNYRFHRSAAFSIGIQGGYAYTWVIAKHFFITGVALAGIGGNTTSLRNEELRRTVQKTGLQADLSYKAAIGYNAETFYAGLLYMGYVQRSNSAWANTWQQYEPSLVRLIVAKRLEVHPPWEKLKKTRAVLDVQ